MHLLQWCVRCKLVCQEQHDTYLELYVDYQMDWQQMLTKVRAKNGQMYVESGFDSQEMNCTPLQSV